MTTAPTTPRLRCASCLRSQGACICRWITPVATQVEVLILQHPLETQHAKNSARLLHLSLPGSRLLTGEAFAAQELQAAFGAAKYTVLLYPPTPGDGRPAPPALDLPRLRQAAKVQLVVLDATWRKSRKMLYLQPLLQQLPRLSLQDAPPSAYRIRKAHKPGQLSTLEATCAALAQLEGDVGTYRPLLEAFDGFVAQQAACVSAGEAQSPRAMTPASSTPGGAA
jgi:DTW domain-containing protein YfiP